MHPLTACLAAAGLLCCGLAGCSVNSGGINVPTVSRRALQEDITRRLAEAGEKPESVTCKQDLIGEVGTTAHRRGVRRQRSDDDVRVGAAEPTL